ncbi:hypothetical protein AB0958_19070 [Streptomyces sp. NPDC006655]|uniref:hypothetical protein n=1 Tax=Streptomyces sp. NPDC006655 TaxID=3156898 RepID=UPI0034532087
MNCRIIRTAPVIPGAVPTEVVRAFQDRLRPDGEHLIWPGTTTSRSIPYLYVGVVRYRARHIAWALHRDTPPVGLVKANCGIALCLRGPHLTDDVIRQRERVQYAALIGVPLTGMCHSGIHELSEWGYAAANGSPGCRGCDNVRRLAATRNAQEGARAA